MNDERGEGRALSASCSPAGEPRRGSLGPPAASAAASGSAAGSGVAAMVTPRRTRAGILREAAKDDALDRGIEIADER